MTPRRKRWLWITAGVFALLVMGLTILSWQLSPWAREKLIQAMREKYRSDVEVGRLDVSLFPTVSFRGYDLVFRHKGRTDVPPLFTIQEIRGDAGWFDVLRKRFTQVELKGLEIKIARGKDADETQPEEASEQVEDDWKGSFFSDAILETVIADGTHLEIIPKQEGKPPLKFDLEKLRMETISRDGPMAFTSILTNPKPPGKIHTEGLFGPWNADTPRQTLVKGNYTFEDADLSVFKGISGILSSEGKYQGTLGRIEVDGTTDTPDFTVSIAGHPVHLKTKFHAIVDGTDGDTYLEPVDATFNKTRILAKGKVEGKEGRKGKAVILDVEVNEGRMEDILLLAVKHKQPIMRGEMRFTTKFLLPPGDRDVMEKLRLDGQFGVYGSHFQKAVQQKVEKMSSSARGEPDDPTPDRVASNLTGRFRTGDGTVGLQDIRFAIPGARVTLDGTYGMRQEELDFRGHLDMDAKLSEATTGMKSLFLKAVDPFFKGKHGGSRVPIKITGSVKEPKFGLAIGGGKKDKKKD